MPYVPAPDGGEQLNPPLYGLGRPLNAQWLGRLVGSLDREFPEKIDMLVTTVPGVLYASNAALRPKHPSRIGFEEWLRQRRKQLRQDGYLDEGADSNLSISIRGLYISLKKRSGRRGAWKRFGLDLVAIDPLREGGERLSVLKAERQAVRGALGIEALQATARNDATTEDTAQRSSEAVTFINFGSIYVSDGTAIFQEAIDGAGHRAMIGMADPADLERIGIVNTRSIPFIRQPRQ